MLVVFAVWAAVIDAHGDISYGMKISRKMIDSTKVESKVHIFETHLGIKFKTQAIKIFHS